MCVYMRMCVYVCVYMRVCVCACISVCVFVYTCEFDFKYDILTYDDQINKKYVNMYIHTHIYVYIRIYTYIYTLVTYITRSNREHVTCNKRASPPLSLEMHVTL